MTEKKNSIIVDAINSAVCDVNIPETEFYHFEPWDVEERSQEIMDQAEADGINLYNDDYARTKNIGAHLFQSGLLLSTKTFRASIAASQTGKTVPAQVEVVIQLTGEIPVSLRHDRGVDTGIRRIISKNNIRRFGRFRDGSFLDNNTKAERDDTWDCGTIIGCGIYPREKIIPNDYKEKTIWIGTTQKAFQENWWPWVMDRDKCMIPDDFIDRSKANNGISTEFHTVHIIGGRRLVFLTFESGFRKFESIRVWWCHFDEESPDNKCLTGAVAHSEMFSISMTPLMGITYTKKMFFPKKPNPNFDVFHACAYDSPYQTVKTIMMTRSVCEDWEIGSKIWGLHSGNVGKPYYNRRKILLWTQNFQRIPERLVEFEPSAGYQGVTRQEFSTVGGLVDVKINAMDHEKEDGRRVWRIYEDVEEGIAYFLVSDAAAGVELKEKEDVNIDELEHGDWGKSEILRSPTREDRNSDGSQCTVPIIVATIQSLVPAEEFAWVCMMASLYYNGALLCSECGQTRGAHNGIFYSEARDYPFWFKQQKKKTMNYKEQKGVDTNVKTRQLFFDCVQVHFSSFAEDDYPHIPDERILEEATECVSVESGKGKKPKPDHPRNGSLDFLICFGQALFVFKHFKTQIQWHRTKGNAHPVRDKSFLEKAFDEIQVDNRKKNTSVFPDLTEGAR